MKSFGLFEKLGMLSSRVSKKNESLDLTGLELKLDRFD